MTTIASSSACTVSDATRSFPPSSVFRLLLSNSASLLRPVKYLVGREPGDLCGHYRRCHDDAGGVSVPTLTTGASATGTDDRLVADISRHRMYRPVINAQDCPTMTPMQTTEASKTGKRY